MKEYQAPQIEVVEFEVKDVVTTKLIGQWFASGELGEWEDNSSSKGNWVE